MQVDIYVLYGKATHDRRILLTKSHREATREKQVVVILKDAAPAHPCARGIPVVLTIKRNLITQ